MTMTTETVHGQRWLGGDLGALYGAEIKVERSDEDELHLMVMLHPDYEREGETNDVDVYLSRAEATRLILQLAAEVEASAP
jgi:hypothetical protein